MNSYDMDLEWEETNGYAPAPVVVAPPAYDLDAPDSEWDGKPVDSIDMAADVLRSGRTLMAICGPLQVTATVMYHDEIQFGLWNTNTCHDIAAVCSFAQLDVYMHTFGYVADGDWFVHCPAEPDGAPQY